MKKVIVLSTVLALGALGIACGEAPKNTANTPKPVNTATPVPVNTATPINTNANTNKPVNVNTNINANANKPATK